MLTLTPYDEFPVHQAPHPFSYIPSTDYNWDDGYFFGAFNPDEQVFLGTGARVNPNSDMIGGYALLNVAGHQITFRFSRCWRRDFNLRVGPWSVEFVEPLKKMRVRLEPNESGLSFDLLWEGTAPAVLEDHHVATRRGRRTTDQSRYSQPGKVGGWIQLRDKRWELDPQTWSGSRDHSWGLYAERPPLGPVASLLPPAPRAEGPQRALRFWTLFRSEPFSGFYHLHEDADGVQAEFNDVFGTPFAGEIFKGFDGKAINFKSGRHEIELVPGTRMLKKATVHLVDENGGAWKQIIEAAAPPWVIQTMGYHPGSWKDGGTFHTYHGSEELATEFDEFDFSVQPFDYKPYRVAGEAAATNFGDADRGSSKLHGFEYLARVTTHAPDGSVSVGAGQVEMFINGPYRPLGLS